MCDKIRSYPYKYRQSQASAHEVSLFESILSRRFAAIEQPTRLCINRLGNSETRRAALCFRNTPKICFTLGFNAPILQQLNLSAATRNLCNILRGSVNSTSGSTLVSYLSLHRRGGLYVYINVFWKAGKGCHHNGSRSIDIASRQDSGAKGVGKFRSAVF